MVIDSAPRILEIAFDIFFFHERACLFSFLTHSSAGVYSLQKGIWVRKLTLQVGESLWVE